MLSPGLVIILTLKGLGRLCVCRRSGGLKMYQFSFPRQHCLSQTSAPCVILSTPATAQALVALFIFPSVVVF